MYQWSRIRTVRSTIRATNLFTYKCRISMVQILYAELPDTIILNNFLKNSMVLVTSKMVFCMEFNWCYYPTVRQIRPRMHFNILLYGKYFKTRAGNKL